MTAAPSKPQEHRTPTRAFSRDVAITLLAWTAAILCLLVYSLHQNAVSVRALALERARAIMVRDMAYRRWVAGHGGVYVPVSPQTPPNPYLAQVKGRDVETTDGKGLTLVNPAYMTRQVHELARALYGDESHITSRNPIRPQNRADLWEDAALAHIEDGDKTEVFAEVELNGTPHFRYMGALRTDESCLACHEAQGYRIGDVRGGISVSLDVSPFLARQDEHGRSTARGLLVLWLAGCVAITLGTRQVHRRRAERDRAREALAREQEADRVIGAVAVRLVGTACPEDMAVDVLEAATRLTSSPEGMVDHRDLDNGAATWMAVAEGGQVRRRAGMDSTTPALAAFLSDPLTASHGVVVINDAGSDPRVGPLPGGPLVRVAVATATVGDGRAGALAVASSPRPYDDEDRRVLGRLADLYAVAALRERDRRYLELVVNGLAHEVRNPLNAIQVSTEALAADLGQDPEHGPFLETITKHVDRMAGLMRELLALRRPLDKERLCHVDLPRLVSGSVALWRTVPGNQEREVRLVLPSGPPPVLPLDPDQLQQVLVNLLDNAHHHSPPGAPLEVAVRSGAGTVSLEVTDHGVGLTPAAAARLFHPFFTTRRGGTGLGLVLVRHIAELHGGTATLVGNVDGPGCTARVELPLAACPRAPSDPAA